MCSQLLQEALFREVPFYACRSEGQIISMILKGNLPAKLDEAGVRGAKIKFLWNCCERCWCLEPADRPTMTVISADLKVSLHRRKIHVSSRLSGYSMYLRGRCS